MPGQFSGPRGMAQMYIPSLISEGFTNSRIVDFLRLNELGYNTQRMYEDINRLRIEHIGAENVRQMSIYEAVPERFMRVWEGDTSYKFRVVIKYEGFSTEKLDRVELGTTLYYKRRPSQEQVLEDWEIRRQTIEGGFGSPQNIQEVYGIKEIHYFKNVPKGAK